MVDGPPKGRDLGTPPNHCDSRQNTYRSTLDQTLRITTYMQLLRPTSQTGCSINRCDYISIFGGDEGTPCRTHAHLRHPRHRKRNAVSLTWHNFKRRPLRSHTSSVVRYERFFRVASRVGVQFLFVHNFNCDPLVSSKISREICQGCPDGD